MSSNNCNKKFRFIVKPILTLVEDKCVSTLISIGDYNLLFDCGWNECFKPEIKNKYEKDLKDIKLDAIFLSNNYLTYFGALPLVKSFPKNSETKIYSTTPIVNLGIYVLIDAYISMLESKPNAFENMNISQETFTKLFFTINKINFLQSIKLNKYKTQKNNINISNKNIDDNENEDCITILSMPSGCTMGGSAWTINYRLYNFLYASEFSIEPKLITDPFPYKKLKKINFFITDNKYQKEGPFIRGFIEEDFNKEIRECFDKKLHIFVPSDNINCMLEMITKFEKLLDDYNENNMGKSDKMEYRVLACSYCSYEIIDGVKSLTEFLGAKISQQFYSFGDKPFNFQYVKCIKSYAEFQNEIKSDPSKKNVRYIILATFETLNIGLGYSILPYVLADKNMILLNIYREYDYKSFFGKIIMEVTRLKNNVMTYIEKKVVETKNVNSKQEDENKNNSENNNDNNSNNNSNNEEEKKESDKSIDLSSNKNNNMEIEENNNLYDNKMVIDKKSLFNIDENNNGYLMFNFEPKNKFTDYGIELTEEEIEIMKKNNEPEHFAYNSNFLAFKKNNLEKAEKVIENFELPVLKIPTKIEEKTKKIEVKCQILYYPLINNMDKMSKRIIIKEINPKNGIILLGNSDPFNDDLQKTMKCKVLKLQSNEKYEEEIVNDIIKFNYDTSFLSLGNKLMIDKGNENVYSFNTLPLRIKTKRNNIIDVSVVDKKRLESNKKIITIENKESKNNKIFSKHNLKLINVKHLLEKSGELKLILSEECLRNLDKTVKIYLKDNELVLDGEFNEDYFKIKSKINEIYFNNIDEFK